MFKTLFKKIPRLNTTILGVVCPPGATGGHSQGEDLWTLTLTLRPWRVIRFGLNEDPLLVERRLTEVDLRKMLQTCPGKYSVARLRVIFTSQHPSRAELIAILGEDSTDHQLQTYAHQLRQPVTRQDRLLGMLTLDRDVDWWEGSTPWLGNPVRVTVAPDENGALEPALQTGRSLWSDQQGWNTRVQDFAVQQLLPLKNDTWLGEDEPRLAPKDFKARMTLETISLEPDGRFTFWHHDGDLFFGHAIQISGDITNGPTDADIPG